jgi:hypothetical protein
MAFLFKKSLVSKDEPTLLYFIIDNSDEITIGDAIMINTDGHAVVATATEEVAGIAVTVVDKNGAKVDFDSGSLNTWTVGTDNETVALKQVAIIVSKDALFSNDSAADLATTNLLQFFDLTSESQISSSGGDTSGQFQLIALDPDGDGDASKGLFKIAESQFDPYAQQ